MHRPWYFRATVTAAGTALTAAFGLAACTDAPTAATAGAPATSVAAGDPTKAQAEVNYMEFTADHHTAALPMVQICLAKAYRRELLDLCQRNLDSQLRERAQVLGWLRDWYGITYTPRIATNLRRSIADLQAQPAGDVFQQRFLYVFPGHHKGIVQKSQQLLPYMVHDSLRTVANTIIVSQTRDIRDMRSWACSWYSQCFPVPGF